MVFICCSSITVLIIKKNQTQWENGGNGNKYLSIDATNVLSGNH